MQYLFALLIPAVVSGAAALLGSWICGMRIWYGDEQLYIFLQEVKNNLLTIILWILIASWLITTVFFMRRLLKHISRVVDAAKQLSAPNEQQIILPPELSEAQTELNAAREAALRSAALAKEAEQRKNDMIVYLAHDLKTPLTSVIGYLSLLSDEPDISAQNREKYTKIALERAQRLEELTNEFFDITRFSLTTLTLEAQRIDLSLMLEQTVSEFAPIFAERSLTAKTEIQQNVDLLCDPDKLERVFDNLLRNAVNYSYPDTEIEFSMSADSELVTLVCQNHGRTIPKEKLSRIFEQFFRVDTARQSKTGGAGLGLAIAKEIVGLHGGEITAESENESVKFTVTLPRK